MSAHRERLATSWRSSLPSFSPKCDCGWQGGWHRTAGLAHCEFDAHAEKERSS